MKVVIMAGGRGQRLMPLTRKIPKPLVPILDRPIIEYVLDVSKKAGIKDVIITLGYLGNKIVDALGDGSKYGVRIKYVYENMPLGTAGGVKNAQKYLDGDFVVLSGDAYTDIDLTELIRRHYSVGGTVTMATHKEKDASRFGVVISDQTGKVLDFEEKPLRPKSDQVNMGIYVFNRKILDVIPQGKSDFSKDIFPKMIGDIYALECDCYWSDIGTLSSYYLTNYDVVRSFDPLLTTAN